MKATFLGSREVTAPDVNLNGSNGERLLKDHLDATDALRAASLALAQITPHGRDYLPQGGPDYTRARDEHQQRQRDLSRIITELEAIAFAIAEQVEARRRQR